MATRDYWLAFGSGNPQTTSGLAPTFIIFVNGSGQTLSPPSITETYVGTGLYKFAYDATQVVAFIVDGATTGLATSDRYIAGVLDPQDTFGVTLNAIGNTQTALGSSLMAYGQTLVAIGTSNIALGTTNVALGTSNIALGTTNVAIGTSLIGIGTSLLLGVSGLSVTLIAIGNTLSSIGLSTGALASLIGDTTSSFGTDSADPTTLFGFMKRALETREGNETYTKASGSLETYSRGSSQLLRTKTVAENASTVTKT